LTDIIITAEMKEDARKCNGRSCTLCRMYPISKGVASSCIEALASLPGVWDQAPEWAKEAWIQWRDGRSDSEYGRGQWREKPYTRTLPKSLIEELSEKYAKEIDTEPMIVKLVQNKLVEMLKEYNERQGGK